MGKDAGYEFGRNYNTGKITTVGQLRAAVFLRKPEEASNIHDAVSMVLTGPADVSLVDAREQFMRGAETAKYPPELVERAFDLLRQIVATKGLSRYGWGMDAEAILAEVEPADPDLVLAREAVKNTLNPVDHKRCDCRAKIDAGEWDDRHIMRATLAAIKRASAQGDAA